MSKLDDIYNKLGDEFYWEGFGVTYKPYDEPEVIQARDEFKRQIKDLMLELAETHAADDANINLASFVAEVNNL